MITKTQYRTAFVGAALTGIFAVANAGPVLSQTEARDRLAVENVRFDDGAVIGRVVNRSGHRIEDVELRVTLDWLWQDEFNPGPSSPATSATLTIPATLAPGDAQEFRLAPTGGLPVRSDGRFSPRVTVIGFTQYAQAAP